MLLTLVAGVYAATHAIGAGDTWLGLAAGREIALHGTPLFAEQFSFNAEKWINQNWGTHLLFHWLAPANDLRGLVALKLVWTVGIALLCFATARVYGAGSLLSAGAAVTVSCLGRYFFDIRPNMFTLLFAAALMGILALAQQRNGRWVFAAIPLTALWVNLHGGYIWAVMALAIFAGGGLCEYVRSRVRRSRHDESKGEALRAARWLSALGVCMACLALAALLSPYGVENITHIAAVSVGPNAARWRSVPEWLPAFDAFALRTPGVKPFWGYLACFAMLSAATVVVRVIPRRSDAVAALPPFPWHALFICVLTAGMAIKSRRFITLMEVVSVSLAARMVHDLSAIYLRPTVAARQGRVLRRGTLGLILAFATPLAWVSILTLQIDQRLLRENDIWGDATLFDRLARADSYPRAATQFLRDNRAGGRVFNAWTWSGMLMWRVSFDEQHKPSYRLFMDGRAQQAFSGRVFADWRKLAAAIRAGQTGVVDAMTAEYGIDLIVMPPGDVHRAVYTSPLWTDIYADDVCVILAREDAASPASDLVSRARAGRLVYPDDSIARVSLGIRLLYSAQVSPGDTLERALDAFLESLRTRPNRLAVLGAFEACQMARSRGQLTLLRRGGEALANLSDTDLRPARGYAMIELERERVRQLLCAPPPQLFRDTAYVSTPARRARAAEAARRLAEMLPEQRW